MSTDAVAGAFNAVPVLDAWDETRALRGIAFALPPELRKEHRLPGQVLRVRCGGGQAYYALASAPAAGPPLEEARAEILVKRGSENADALVAEAQAGAHLHVSSPLGPGFPASAAEGRDALLFAVGSGIAPMRALIQHLCASRQRYGRIILFYGQREADEFAYVAEHERWERDGVRVVLCTSSGADARWTGQRGRVHEVARELRFGGADLGSAVAFICGMELMVADVRRELEAAGLRPEHAFLNY